jgi:hypothetical protein
MTAADKFTWSTYDTLLRRDFVSFAQRCFRELSPRTELAYRDHRCEIDGVARGPNPAADHQHAAALSLGRAAYGVARADGPGG